MNYKQNEKINQVRITLVVGSISEYHTVCESV